MANFFISYTRRDNHVNNKELLKNFNDGMLKERNYYKNASSFVPGLGPRCINRSIGNSYYSTDPSSTSFFWGRDGRDRIVVELTTTYAISAYHH